MWINLAIAALGVAAGMLVNYLADILPVKRNISPPLCLHCGQGQPIGNYLFLPRRCPHCGTRRPARVWLVEIGFAALFLWLWHTPAALRFLPFWLAVVLLIFFGLVVIIDLEHRLILHPVSVAGALLGFTLGTYLHGIGATLAGGAVGYAVMLAFYLLGALFSRFARGKPGGEVALGFGDVNLSGVIGLILGLPQVWMGLILSVLGGGLISLFLVLGMLAVRRYRAFLAIPYGPFLVLGAFILLFLPDFGQQVILRVGPLFWLGSP
jgi:leader peptidase (prepilin peptidase)/N-methyltransferase